MKLLEFSKPVLVLLPFCLNSCSCGPENNAPAELAQLSRYLYANAEAEEDAVLHEAIVNLHDVLKSDEITEHVYDVLDDIQPEDVAYLEKGFEDLNLELGQGIFAVGTMDCTIDEILELQMVDDQPSLYPEDYTSYAREYTTDKEAFVSGDVNVVEYNTEYSPSGLDYTGKNALYIRRLPDTAADGEEDLTPFGETLVIRKYLREPAVFPEGSENKLPFDFQFEVYYQRSDKKLVHYQVSWRYIDLGIVGDSSSDLYFTTITDNYIEGDAETEALCQGLR